MLSEYTAPVETTATTCSRGGAVRSAVGKLFISEMLPKGRTGCIYLFSTSPQVCADCLA